MRVITRIGQSLRPSHSARQEANRDSERGFSLFEIIIVVAIIGILSAVAVPTFSTWRARSAVDNASKALLAHLKQARVTAMARNRNVSITFEKDASNKVVSYTYDGDASCANPSHEPYKCDKMLLSTFSKNLNVTWNRDPDPITFKSRGTTQTVTVTIASGQFSHLLTVNMIGRAYQQ